MSNVALFIKPEVIKQDVYVDENVDVKYIINATAIAQELYILPILGTGLYDEISSQITAGTLSAINTTLLTSYIQPALKYWVFFEAVEMLNMKVSNKAIMKKNSDNSQPIDLNDVLHLKDKFRNIAEWKTERIIRYLLQAQTSYPLYLNPGNGVDTIYPKHNSYSVGWNLNKKYGCSSECDVRINHLTPPDL